MKSSSPKNTKQSKAKTTAQKSKSKRLPFSFGKTHVLIVAAVVLSSAGIGAYMLKESQARTAPSMIDCLYVGFRPRLQKGTSQTACTAAVQHFLRGNGYSTLKVDGIYGDITTLAVASYQLRNGLPKTGIVDKNTWGAMSSDCYRNTSSHRYCSIHARY